MSQPERMKVRAIIPSREKPPRYVVDQMGLYPEIEVGTLDRSSETLLHEIGRKILMGAHLSVDSAARANHQVPYSQVSVNIANMTTDSVDPESVTLSPGYHWDRM
jgi:hypothetical protein